MNHSLEVRLSSVDHRTKVEHPVTGKTWRSWAPSGIKMEPSCAIDRAQPEAIRTQPVKLRSKAPATQALRGAYRTVVTHSATMWARALTQNNDESQLDVSHQSHNRRVFKDSSGVLRVITMAEKERNLSPRTDRKGPRPILPVTQ
jgi:hypothetical protein